MVADLFADGLGSSEKTWYSLGNGAISLVPSGFSSEFSESNSFTWSLTKSDSNLDCSFQQNNPGRPARSGPSPNLPQDVPSEKDPPRGDSKDCTSKLYAEQERGIDRGQRRFDNRICEIFDQRRRLPGLARLGCPPKVKGSVMDPY